MSTGSRRLLGGAYGGSTFMLALAWMSAVRIVEGSFYQIGWLDVRRNCRV